MDDRDQQPGSEYGSAPEPSGHSAAPPRPPISQQAVASAVCGAFLCCPATSVVAAVLAFRALRAVRLSGGALRGRRLALLGLLLASMGLFAQALTFGEVVGRTRQQIEDGAAKAIEATFGDSADRSASWLIDGRPGEASVIEAFVDEATTRYGELERVSITTPLESEGGLGMRFSAPVTFYFQEETRVGGATFSVRQKGVWLSYEALLERLVISDGERGDLILPPASPETPQQADQRDGMMPE